MFRFAPFLLIVGCTCGPKPCATAAECGAGNVCLPIGSCAPACGSGCIAGEKCSAAGACVPASGCGSDLDCTGSQRCLADGHCGTSGTGGGSGGGSAGGAGGSGGGASCVPQLVAKIRDFSDTHPDFEQFLGSKKGIVQTTLGADHKPVYGPEPQTAPIVTSTKANFDQWYRDTSGVNQATVVTLPLTEGPPMHFVYDNSNFFPVDGQLLGNQGRNHNFHFTTEIHGTFTYRGGEIFTFRGDDDVFVFVNNKLALDLGGVHAVESGTIDFDAQATALGIAKGSTYPLDVFHAERHTVESNFRVETTIGCLTPVMIQ